MKKIIDGLSISSEILQKLEKKLLDLRQKFSLVPLLRVVIVGTNPASEVYVRNKQKKAEKLGMDAQTIKIDEDVTQSQLCSVIEQMNNDKSVNGILVQLPLPKHIDSSAVIDIISDKKDVDGFNKKNVAALVLDKNTPLKPCTPTGCLYLIKSVLGDNLSGLDAIVIGRSNIVGKPMATLLLHESCTVTIAHSKTKNLQEKTRQADIVIAAAGIPKLINSSFVKSGATVIDVGINKVDGKIIGDVDFDDAKEKAGFITPVPGGVGPMTIAFLMLNTIIACCIQNNVDYSDLLLI